MRMRSAVAWDYAQHFASVQACSRGNAPGPVSGGAPGAALAELSAALEAIGHRKRSDDGTQSKHEALAAAGLSKTEAHRCQ